MDISIWAQLNQVKMRVLELTSALMEEDEEVFTREQAILDLMDISKELFYLEEKAMNQMDRTDRRQVSELAAYKDSLRQTKNASGAPTPETFDKSVM
ncbi:hypothetical protein [Paenibacillus durus]|nr:hypothetical protein [Paenibacillus durus]